MGKILFVCGEGRNRSEAAAIILRSILARKGYSEDSVDIKTAGLRADASGRTSRTLSEVLQERGYSSLQNYSPRQVSRNLLISSDLVLTMGPAHTGELVSAFLVNNPSQARKIHSLPEYATNGVFHHHIDYRHSDVRGRQAVLASQLVHQLESYLSNSVLRMEKEGLVG